MPVDGYGSRGVKAIDKPTRSLANKKEASKRSRHSLHSPISTRPKKDGQASCQNRLDQGGVFSFWRTSEHKLRNTEISSPD